MLWRKKPADFTTEFEKGEPISYQGRTLWSAHWAPTATGDRWFFDFESFTSAPVQGLMVAGREKTTRLQIEAHRAQQFVLWTDSAPRHVELSVVSARNGASIGFWNVWRDEKHGTMLYGLNAAAIDVQKHDNDSITLHCSDGWRGPDFRDLVVRIRKIQM